MTKILHERLPRAIAALCNLNLYVIPVSFVGWRHGRVQRLTLRFSFSKQPVDGPDLIDTFICNCVDCRKITASMFASNFIVADRALTHVRGQDKLKSFGQSATIATGNTMTNYFCGTCGTLMYRVSSGSPGLSVLRIGTVDDFSLHETKLKPRVEQFVRDRVSWCSGGEKGEILQVQSNHFARGKETKDTGLSGVATKIRTPRSVEQPSKSTL